MPSAPTASSADAVEQPTVVSSWTPHVGQRAIMEHPARFRIVSCGRRWGKSVMAAHIALRFGLENPDATIWWVSPMYDQSNEYGYDNIKALLTPEIAGGEPKRTKPREIPLSTGATISFRAGSREDALRGGGVDLLVIDEAGSVPERAWTEELRPTLSDTLGKLVTIGTPKGRNWFWRWWQRGQSPEQPDVASWAAPTYQNPHVPDSEIDSARGDVPERIFEQEYLAEFLEAAAALLAARDTSELDETTLEQLETYLAANFLRLNYEREATEKTAMDVTVRYPERGGGIGLRATGTGQMVLELDTVGLFAPASSSGGFVDTASPHTDRKGELAEREREKR